MASGYVKSKEATIKKPYFDQASRQKSIAHNRSTKSSNHKVPTPRPRQSDSIAERCDQAVELRRKESNQSFRSKRGTSLLPSKGIETYSRNKNAGRLGGTQTIQKNVS